MRTSGRTSRDAQIELPLRGESTIRRHVPPSKSNVRRPLSGWRLRNHWGENPGPWNCRSPFVSIDENRGDAIPRTGFSM